MSHTSTADVVMTNAGGTSVVADISHTTYYVVISHSSYVSDHVVSAELHRISWDNL